MWKFLLDIFLWHVYFLQNLDEYKWISIDDLCNKNQIFQKAINEVGYILTANKGKQCYY